MVTFSVLRVTSPPQGSEFHFQPIAEDEPSPDPSPHISPAHRGGDVAWAGLPNYMAQCSVSEGPNLPNTFPNSPLPYQTPPFPYQPSLPLPSHHPYPGPPAPYHSIPYLSRPPYLEGEEGGREESPF